MIESFKKLYQSLFTSSSTPEEAFWNWFLANQRKIEKFIDSDLLELSIYHKLTARMQKYNDLLVPELTKTKDDTYVLIITPDGIKDGIKPTQKLGGSHPEIKGWEVKKFRQATDEISLNINGLEYPSSDIEIVPELDEEAEKVHIQLFIRNMNKDPQNHQHLAFLYLDHILGEFNTITRVGAIDFYELKAGQTAKGSISLLELRKLIERELY